MSWILYSLQVTRMWIKIKDHLPAKEAVFFSFNCRCKNCANYQSDYRLKDYETCAIMPLILTVNFYKREYGSIDSFGVPDDFVCSRWRDKNAK